ncbi:MAG: FecR family protein [Pedobacter sp.]|uniref:FecR family protein n=1 Tax=Pedobacter sp. TaxID=1411316 RepID=UPI00356ACFD2
MMKSKEAIILLEKYENGTITKEELTLLESWYNHQASIGKAEISDEELEENLAGIWTALPQASDESHKKNIRIWPMISIAASVLAVLSVGFYFYNLNKTQKKEAMALLSSEIIPGGNKAYLTLSNGKRISLTEAENGTLAKQEGVTITKTDDGQLIYKVTNTGEKGGVSAFNTIETPNGGQYQVLLPDGTKVWLNAASMLTYPVNFGKNERRVELSGEGYFEVAKNKLKPFRIKTDRQEVTVLGTHFNVNNYKDETKASTTLLTGSVSILNLKSSERAILKPDEQGILNEKSLSVQQVNAEDAIAWKNGEFLFNDEPLESIMRQISRWYDIDVEYKGVNPTDRFGGSISRFENVTKVLEKLELTGGIHFKIQHRTIIVTN